MNASINCPNGHGNPSAQKFCGQCGISLVGVCANGHSNAEGQKFCGQCGVPLGQSELASAKRPAPVAAEPPSSAPGIGVGATPPLTDHPPQERLDSSAGLSDGLGAAAVGATLRGGLGGLKSLWAKLPKWGKVTAVLAPVLLVVVALMTGGGRDRESYEFGYQRGQAALTQELARGSSPKEACRSNVDFFKVMVRSKKIDVDDAVEGCLDALKGRPLAPGG